jgi:PAS domain S-box-containing protein
VHGHVPSGHVAPADPFCSVTDAVYRIDHTWRFTYVNAAAGRLLGRRVDEMLGRYAFECFPDTLGTVIEDVYRAVLTDGRGREFHYFYPPLDRWFEIRAFADAGGLTAFLRDIDDQHRADQQRVAELRQLSAMLEALPPATVVLAGDGRIEMVNRAWTANGEALERRGDRAARVGE